jgi:prephenate dehydrogenase
VTILDPDSHVSIVGCGLIGGSFALALRRAGFKGRLTAWDDPATIRLAVERGVIDGPEESFNNGTLTQARLLFLAAPIGGIVDFLRRHAHLISPRTIVTDAGSTKAEICQVARNCLPAEVSFIGGHPMAGSEHSGVEYSRADLFDRATWALVPEPTREAGSFEEIRALVETIGARPITVSPEEHDRTVAIVSHLPQIISTTLASLLATPYPSTPLEAGSEMTTTLDPLSIDLARTMAAGGWRDMTRLAASSFGIWRDIIITNQPHLTSALDQFIARLQLLSEGLERRDFQAARTLFEEANRSVTQLRETRYRPFDKI